MLIAESPPQISQECSPNTTAFLPHRYDDGVWETHKHLKMVELQQERGGPTGEGYMSVKLRQRPMNEWLIRQQAATTSETAPAKFNLRLILLSEVGGLLMEKVDLRKRALSCFPIACLKIR